MLLLLGLLLLALAGYALVRLVVADGYGHRPAPRSHPEEPRWPDPVHADRR